MLFTRIVVLINLCIVLQCINPLGAISLSNYIIIRGTDCSRTCMFKLVKYGQKTYYVQTESEEDMNR